ncbi:hypothetical protein R9X47_07635 [Wukongibacter baidiensis]|uniref:hypothetical protein n=1 Tax=Wukongibacter baidiensis TaxID=1723361 RepID=UPI003D7FD9C8
MKNFIAAIIIISMIFTMILPLNVFASQDSDHELEEAVFPVQGQVVRDCIYKHDMVFGDDKFVLVGGAWGDLACTSEDGTDWSIHHLDESVDEFNRVIYEDDKFIAISNLELILLSKDGEEWTNIEIDIDDDQLYDIIYDGDKFIAVGEDGYIISSEDGYEWDEVDSDTDSTLFGISYGNDKYVAVGEDGIILISDDGEEWEELYSQTDLSLNAIIYAQDKFVAKGPSGIVLLSDDGEEWEKEEFEDIDYDDDWKPYNGKIVYGNGKFIIDDGYISDAGVVWSELEDRNGIIAFGDDKFLSVGNSVRESYNGEDWEEKWLLIWAAQSNIVDLAYGDDRFVGVTPYGIILSSEKGDTWSVDRDDYWFEHFHNVIYGDNKFIAVGYDTIVSSNDGKTWESIDIDIDFHSPSNILFGNDTFIIVNDDGEFLISDDGYNWDQESIDKAWKDLAFTLYDNDKYIVIDEDGYTYFSEDGYHWNEVDTNLDDVADDLKDGRFIGDLHYGNGKYLLNYDGDLFASDDAQDWQKSDADAEYFDIVFSDNKFIAFEQYERKNYVEKVFVYASTDGINWVNIGEYNCDLDKYDRFNTVIYGDDRYILGGDSGKIFYIDADDLDNPIIPPIDNEDVDRFETAYDVDSDKDWKIKFNSKIDEDSIDNIGVLNSFGSNLNNIDIDLYDSKTVIINAPKTGYSSGEKYTIVIEDVVDINGKSLERKVVKDFIIKD